MNQKDIIKKLEYYKKFKEAENEKDDLINKIENNKYLNMYGFATLSFGIITAINGLIFIFEGEAAFNPFVGAFAIIFFTIFLSTLLVVPKGIWSLFNRSKIKKTKKELSLLFEKFNLDKRKYHHNTEKEMESLEKDELVALISASIEDKKYNTVYKLLRSELDSRIYEEKTKLERLKSLKDDLELYTSEPQENLEIKIKNQEKTLNIISN